MEFMKIKGDMRKFAELGVGAIAISTLILAGCGGGGGGSSSAPPAVAGTASTIVPFKGMFKNGTVTLTDNAGNPVQLISGGTINANGVASVTYPTNVQYPLVVSVTGSYINEAKGGATETATAPLRGFVASSAAAASGVPVTAITEMAVAQIALASSGVSDYTLSNNNVNTAINNVVSELGIPNTVPSFDANGGALDGNTVALEGIALAIASNSPAGSNLAAAISKVGQNLAAALATGSASSVAATVSANIPNLTSKWIPQATSNNTNSLASNATIPAGPPALPPAVVPVGAVSASGAAKIATATTLLNSLNTGLLQQAAGVQTDLNSINSPFQEAQNFALFLYQGMTLASNGSLTNKTLSQSVTVNGYPCVLTSVTGGTGTPYVGTAICQWANNNVNTAPTIHQLTITGPNVSTGVLNLIPQGSYTWSDSIIQSITLSTINSAAGVSAPGITPVTGTALGNGASITLNGSILPGAGPTATDSLTSLSNFAVTVTANPAVAGANPTNTYGMTGTITELAGTSTVIDSITLNPGSQVVQDAVNYHTVSAILNTVASTQNYRFNGTLTMANFAKDKLSSTNPNPGWNPGTVSFTGSVSGVNANSSLGQFLTTTGSGLTVNSDRTQYDPTLPVRYDNFPTESAMFSGSFVNGSSTYSVSLNIFTGTSSTTYNNVSALLTYADSSSNAVTVSGSTTGLMLNGATSVNATLGGNNTGSVYSGSAVSSAALIGNIVNGVVSFIDNSTFTLN